jgi:hypothetical protein
VKRFAKGTAVVVYWNDAGDHAAEWKDADHVEPADFKMVTYGAYLCVKKKHVLLAGTYCPGDETANSVSQIPVGCVTRMVKLKE